MKVIFLDFDGVVTAKNGTPGSYMTHGPEKYGPTPVCVDRLMKLVKDSGAKIVISSNWRKFDIDGPGSIWKNRYGSIKNPLPRFIPMLGDAYLGSLPVIQLCKAAVADYWLLHKKSDIESFVALDDMCAYEGYDQFEIFRGRYINTNSETGLTDKDCEKALTILRQHN